MIDSYFFLFCFVLFLLLGCCCYCYDDDLILIWLLEWTQRLEFGEFLFEFAGRRGFEWLLVVLVEIAGVALLALGYEGRLDLLLVDGYPVGGGEPFVVLDVIDAVLQVAESFGQIDLE